MNCSCACHITGTSNVLPHDVPGCDGTCGAMERRCAFPGCLDPSASSRTDKVPRLLYPDEAVFCRGCRNRYRRVLDWLLEDYATIDAAMPTPLGAGGDKIMVSREYGHPAEWASDMKRRIADTVDGWANALRDHQHHTPANPHRREARKLATEHKYLTAHFDTLCVFPGALDAAEELCELHADIRRALGQSRASTKLDTPCPACDLITMRRTVELDRSDWIECMNCGYSFEEKYYKLYTKIVSDGILDGDTPAA